MKALIVLYLMTLLAGCGMGVHVDPIKSEPVQVVHTININFDSVLNYCNRQCAQQNTDPAYIQSCGNTCYTNFVEILAHAFAPPPAGTPNAP